MAQEVKAAASSLSEVSGADALATSQAAPVVSHWRDLYPFESNYLDLGGSRDPLRLHYVDHGPTAGSGDSSQETFLFVHGNPTWSFYWRHLVLGLGGTARCVAVDHMGCGLSDKPQRYRYTLDQHIQNLCELIDHLELQNVTLVAHDWGGAIGTGALLDRPDRFKRIVLMNTGAFPPPYVPWQIQLCRIPLIGTIAIRMFNGFAAPALKIAVNRPGGLDPIVKKGLVAPYHDWASRIATDKFVKDIPRRESDPTWKRLDGIEKGLTSLTGKPVQLIWGMKDWCFRPDCLRRFQKLFPHAKSHQIDWANHYVVEEAPEEVLETIQKFVATS